MNHATQSATSQARRSLLLGLGLAMFLTVFVDIAVLVVPIYDMQLYDRVLLSRNMSTVAMLSVACTIGLAIYALLDYLRSAALITIADQVGRALSGPVLEAAVLRGIEGDSAAGAEALRDLSEVRQFLSSGAVCVPLDALASPLLLAVMFMLHPAFGWLGVAGISILTIVGVLNDHFVRPAMTAAAQQRTRAGHQLAVGLAEPDLIEGLGMFPALARRWVERHAAALQSTQATSERSLRIGLVSKIARLSLQAGVMAMGAMLIISREASAGSLMGANLLLAKVLGPFDSLVTSWRRWIEAWAAWSRISRLLATADCDTTANDAEPVTDDSGLVLAGVGFAPPGSTQCLLDDVSVRLAPGTATALTGPNGAGKSTLMRLIVGVLPASAGTIRLHGVPIRSADMTQIGYLPQGIHLLDGTITDNIGRFGDGVPDTVIAAAQDASVHEFIGRLKKGYDTRITRAGSLLSGGQRQRIALARALHGLPRLLVLDEPDASLDQEGEQALLQAIDTARSGGSIVLISTHRPKLLERMDYILSLHNGRIESFITRARNEDVADPTREHVVA